MEKTKILVVEDEGLVAMDIRNTLEKLGYEVTCTAISGEEALHSLDYALPDLVLMDIMLAGDMDGTETAAAMAIKADLPVVYLTAYSDDETLQRVKLTGPYGYLHKPYTERELRTSIETAIYKHQMERALKESEDRLRALNLDLERRVEIETHKRMQHERLMLQQSKMAAMGEMINAIAHQWRQPLNVVGLTLEGIREAYHYSELTREMFDEATENVVKQVRFMTKTIDDFRDFFRPSKEKTVFDVKAAMAEALSIVSSQLKSDFISCDLRCVSGGVTVEGLEKFLSSEAMQVSGYRNEFEQAAINLLNNAKDAIIESKRRGVLAEGELGAIVIECRKEGGLVSVHVTDNGGGIGPDAMQRICEPFFTTKDAGTGIGLYLARTIIEENMGGRLLSGNSERGAEFIIQLMEAGEAGAVPSA